MADLKPSTEPEQCLANQGAAGDQEQQFLTKGESRAVLWNRQGSKASLKRCCGTCSICLIERWLKLACCAHPRSIGTVTRMEAPIGWPW